MDSIGGHRAVVKSLLGTSPISSVPFVLSTAFPLSLGAMTFIVNMVFLAGQLALMGRRFQKMQLVQIPVTLIFALFIDFYMYVFAAVAPMLYVAKLAILLLGAAGVALGVSLQVIANVVMLPGEAIVNAIAVRWHIDFGRTKTVFDTTLVVLAVAFSFAWLDSIEGVREGTLISALITGTIARFFILHLSKVDALGQLVFAPHLSSERRTSSAAKIAVSEKN